MVTIFVCLFFFRFHWTNRLKYFLLRCPLVQTKLIETFNNTYRYNFFLWFHPAIYLSCWIHRCMLSVEELQCLATWKEGSSRYLVGKLHHSHATSNEDRFRCFVYEKASPASEALDGVDYRVAQSGDATCNGLFSATEGSRTMTLKKGTMNAVRSISIGARWALLSPRVIFKPTRPLDVGEWGESGPKFDFSTLKGLINIFCNNLMIDRFLCSLSSKKTFQFELSN